MKITVRTVPYAHAKWVFEVGESLDDSQECDIHGALNLLLGRLVRLPFRVEIDLIYVPEDQKPSRNGKGV